MAFGLCLPKSLCVKKIAVAWSPCYDVIMIKQFKNKGTEDIFNGKNSKKLEKLSEITMGNRSKKTGSIRFSERD